MKLFSRALITLFCSTLLITSCSINMEEYYGIWTDAEGGYNLSITPKHLVVFSPEHIPDIAYYELKGKKILLDSGYEYAVINNKTKSIILTEAPMNPLSIKHYSLDELNCLTGGDDYDYSWDSSDSWDSGSSDWDSDW